MGVSPTRSPAARSALPARASTLPLPFVPATSAPRTAELRIAQLAQEGPRPSEAQADPEPAAVGERGSASA